VIAQGTEAGGHTGLVATMPLVPQVVDAVGDRVPVVAAGGIFDGRGLAAALTLGADGVWIGTRFIATPEAHVVSGYREALVAGHEDDTVITRAYTGKTLRAIRNDYTQYFEDHPDELQRFPDQIGRSLGDGAMHLGAPPDASGVDPDRECYAAGQGVGAVAEVTPAGDIVRAFVADAERELARVSELVTVRT
ncbi:MAG: NAD(P)H-dependent flavin oxidoreductase, partial [Rhodococcus sp. (in: high G+C Gram-positive bacteria)]